MEATRSLSSDVSIGKKPPRCPGMRRRLRSEASRISKTADFHRAKSFAFLACNGKRSSRGMMIVAKCVGLATFHLACGFCPGRLRHWRWFSRTVPHPKRRAIASRTGLSSRRRAMRKCAFHRSVLVLFRGGCLSSVKHPSPSINPLKYQPKASSESKSIEWTSLTPLLLYSRLLAGAASCNSLPRYYTKIACLFLGLAVFVSVGSSMMR
jgi:hypothetical protein